ncbi:smg-9, nonsense mediated mRNA decay factor [Quaeritorhiza haematococci]|nr:smg-9, nonsense mediated mRNA decay factor [Quaeritorhiza haematococci]
MRAEQQERARVTSNTTNSTTANTSSRSHYVHPNTTVISLLKKPAEASSQPVPTTTRNNVHTIAGSNAVRVNGRKGVSGEVELAGERSRARSSNGGVPSGGNGEGGARRKGADRQQHNSRKQGVGTSAQSEEVESDDGSIVSSATGASTPSRRRDGRGQRGSARGDGGGGEYTDGAQSDRSSTTPQRREKGARRRREKGGKGAAAEAEYDDDTRSYDGSASASASQQGRHGGAQGDHSGTSSSSSGRRRRNREREKQKDGDNEDDGEDMSQTTRNRADRGSLGEGRSWNDRDSVHDDQRGGLGSARSGRRRRPRDHRGNSPEAKLVEHVTPTFLQTPMILQHRSQPSSAGTTNIAHTDEAAAGVTPSSKSTAQPTTVLFRGQPASDKKGQVSSRPSDDGRAPKNGENLAASIIRRLFGPFAASASGSPAVTTADKKAKIYQQPQQHQRVRIIDELLRMHPEPALKFLNEQPGCFIVGVLGRRGVGKSTIMSALASSFEKSHGDDGDIFPMHAKGPSMSGPHVTTGIDLYVTPERVVFLDTMPIFAQSVLDRYKKDRDRETGGPIVVGSSSASGTGGNGGLSATASTVGAPSALPDSIMKRPHTWLEIHATMLTMFLFSVCHVLVVVSDEPADEELWAFLRRVERFKGRVIESQQQQQQQQQRDRVKGSPHHSQKGSSQQPQQKRQAANASSRGGSAGAGATGNPQAQTTVEDEFYPEVIFVSTRAPAEAFSPQSLMDVSERVDKAFDGSKLRTTGAVNMVRCFPDLYGKQVPRPLSRAVDEGEDYDDESLPNIFLLPDADPNPGNHPALHQSSLPFAPTDDPFDTSVLEALLDRHVGLPARAEVLFELLRDQVLEIPRFAVPSMILSGPPSIVRKTTAKMTKTTNGAGGQQQRPVVVNIPGGMKKWFQVSERDWFRSAYRIWDGIRKTEGMMSMMAETVSGGVEGGAGGRDVALGRDTAGKGGTQRELQQEPYATPPEDLEKPDRHLYTDPGRYGYLVRWGSKNAGRLLTTLGVTRATPKIGGEASGILGGVEELGLKGGTGAGETSGMGI